MKISRAAVVLSLVIVFLAGCGSGDGSSGSASKADRHPQKLKSLRLTLEGYPDAENVGVLMADQEGYFAEAGFDVEVLHPVDSDNVPEYLDAEADDLGLLPQPQVVMSRQEGIPLVAVGSVVGRPTMALIWAKGSSIGGLADLKGKTIAINGFSFEEGLLEALLAQAGLTPKDVQIKSVSYGLAPALIKGRADAILGSGNIEGVELEAGGLEPVVTPLQDFGVPAFEELVMVTRRNRLAGNPDWVRPLVAAVTRGTAAAIEDPNAAAAAIAAARERLELPAATPESVEAKVNATLPLLAQTAQMSPERATHLSEWMHEHGMIQREQPATAWLTNRYAQPHP